MTATDHGFRRDIEGLRGLAVALIVLYHAGVPGLAGGYVGVDVFYVISGYLITRLLHTELLTEGTVRLPRFYARRARRILPAAFMVLVATLVGAFLLESPLLFRQTAIEVAAGAAFVPNILFAMHATDYLHPLVVSPVLHYWSLGVEEQFYLLWPVLVILSSRAIRDTDGRRLIRPMVVVVIGSFLLCVLDTWFRPTDAFYMLPMRAWELGVGGLIGLAGIGTQSVRRRSILELTGLGMIGAAATLFSDQTQFPGFAAVVPVCGAAMVIVAPPESSGSFSSRLLRASPLAFLGRISYSLYLWHWPLLVFVAGLWPNRPAPVMATAVAAAVGLAALTYRYVERPLRNGVAIGTRPGPNLGLALTGSLILVAGSLMTGKLAAARFDGPELVLDHVGLARTPAEQLEPRLYGALPVDLIPALANVNETVPQPTLDGCNVTGEGDHSGPCTYGTPGSTTTVVLFGDSHALQWFPAVEQLALARRWRLVSLTKDACPYAEIPRLTYGNRPDTACVRWRTDAIARIGEIRPRLVVATSNHEIVPSVEGRDATSLEAIPIWEEGIRRSMAQLVTSAESVVVLADTPESQWDVPDCLSANADRIEACAFPRGNAVDSQWIATERQDVDGSGGWYVDTSDWICPTDPCAVVRGRFLVFTDTNHLAWPFVTALTSDLSRAIDAH